MARFQNIVVPVDFSENSRRAVDYGIDMAKDRKAKLYFFHVINQRHIDTLQDLSIKGYKGDFLEAIRNMLQARDTDLREFVPQESLKDLDVEFIIRKGKPGEEILKFAEEKNLDLIVIGTQGRSAIKATLMGSAAQSVVNRAKCPVLVIHPR